MRLCLLKGLIPISEFEKFWKIVLGTFKREVARHHDDVMVFLHTLLFYFISFLSELFLGEQDYGVCPLINKKTFIRHHSDKFPNSKDLNWFWNNFWVTEWIFLDSLQ